MERISTSSLSKQLKKSSKELFGILSQLKLIYRKNDSWHLTSQGKEYGGEVVFNNKYGEFIVWPSTFNPLDLKSNDRTKLINATKIGENYQVSSQRVNRVLAELGWIEKGIKGWNVNKVGRSLGGVEFDHDSGGTYVLWPSGVLTNKDLNESFHSKEELTSSEEKEIDGADSQQTKNPRDKWPTPYRTKDGHRVGSRGEQMIDDYLYECGIVHAYEREVKNIEETVLSDFYIPAKNGGEPVYIEYWGQEDEKYDLRKTEKKEIYKKNNLNLIELDNKHIYSLDDHLPRMLLKFKIKT
ncbi:MAG: glycerol kinase [Bacteroidetes bacterium]|nr:glycerol kinase [Bacteroidota bacterium]